MRLSELLHSEVYDAGGVEVGSVDDVRLVQDGPPLAGGDASLRVAGLVIGHRAVGIRLGFLRGRVEGPAPLKWLFERLERRARYADWSQVRTIEDGVVRLSAAVAELGPPPAG